MTLFKTATHFINDGIFRKLPSQLELKSETLQRLQLERVGIFVFAPEIGDRRDDGLADGSDLSRLVFPECHGVNGERLENEGDRGSGIPAQILVGKGEITAEKFWRI